MLQFVPIQIFRAFNGFDLRQDRSGGLIVTRNGDALAAAHVLAIANRYDNDSRFAATAARNPKHFL
jgi:hypothetical protein